MVAEWESDDAYRRWPANPIPEELGSADRAAAHRRCPGRRTSEDGRQIAARRSGQRHDPRRHRRRRHLHRPRLLLDRPRDRARRRSSPRSPTRRRPTSSAACSTCWRRAASQLGEIAFLAHGTTLVINALTERKGVKTALITTEGFRDSLEIARGNRPDFFNLHYEKPPPVRAALPAPRGAGPPHPRRRRAAAARPRRPAGDPRRLPRRGRRGGRDLPPPLLRRPEPRAGGARRGARALAGGLGRRLAPDHPRVARVRAHEHRRPLGLRPAGRRALPQPARRRRPRRAASTASSTSCSRTAASTRSRRRSEIPITMVESGPASGVLGRRRARPADRRAERARARHRRHDREVLADRGRPREDHDRLLDRAQPRARPATRSWCRSSTWSRSATAAAASPGSTTSASCMSARSRPARCPARPPTAAAAPRRRRPTPTSRSAASTGTTSAAARSTPTWRPSTRRSTRSRARLGVDRERGGARHRPHRQQQHGQRAQAGLAQPRLRPARLHARRLRRRRRHARRRAGGRARHPQGRHPARRRRLLGLGHDDERPPPRLLRHPPDRSERRGRADGSTRCSPRWPRRALEQFARGGHRRPSRCASCATASCATRTRSTASRCRFPTARSTRAAVERSRRRSTRPTSASTPTASTRRSRSSASTSSRSPRSASSTPARLPVTGRRARRRARRAARDVDYAIEGVHEADIYDGDRLEPGHELRRARRSSRRRAARWSSIPATRVDGRRLRQPRHLDRRRHVTARRRPTRSPSRSSRTRCRRSATRCSPPCARRR